MTENRTWDVVSGPGITALGLAASRSVESARPDHLIEDPWGAAFVAAVDSPVVFPTRWPAEDDAVTNQQALHLHGSRYIGVRSRFYDDFLASAAQSGVQQMVLLAAGLDTRAFRLTWPSGVTVFEVAEGLLAYLPPDAEERLLQQIQELSAPGSNIAVDRILAVDRLGEDGADDAALDELSKRSGIEMNTLIDTLARQDCAQWLRANGWTVRENNVVEIAHSYGRDLSDPFARQVTPPWLETGFITGRLTLDRS